MTARALFVMASLAAGCGTQQTRGHPLYPKLGPERGLDAVALLRGPIQDVDGQDVSAKGQTFELLPGCHLVALQRNIRTGTAAGGWAANVGRLVIPFRMRAGHSYSIVMETDDASGPVGRVHIVARERSPSGAVTRVPFAASDDDILDCQRWADAQSAAGGPNR
jgi:hypothetical protein